LKTSTIQIVLFFVFTICQIVDTATTIKILYPARPNYIETNSIVRWLMERIGIREGAILAGVLSILGVGAALYYFPHPIVMVVVGLGCAVKGYVIDGNFRVLRGM
jgi:hypothetical protein